MYISHTEVCPTLLFPGLPCFLCEAREVSLWNPFILDPTTVWGIVFFGPSGSLWRFCSQGPSALHLLGRPAHRWRQLPLQEALRGCNPSGEFCLRRIVLFCATWIFFLFHFSTNSPVPNSFRQRNYNLLDKQKQWGRGFAGSQSVRGTVLVSMVKELQDSFKLYQIELLNKLGVTFSPGVKRKNPVRLFCNISMSAFGQGVQPLFLHPFFAK